MVTFKSMNQQSFLHHSIKNFCQFICLTILMSSFLILFGASQAAEKKTAKSNSINKSDSKKFDELKLTDASIWRCENNIIVKTAESTQGYLMLWNNKLYTMTKIDALRGVQRYTNDTYHLNWIEIPDKAMLFDFKIGQRVLDYCKTPELVANSPRINQEDLLK